MALAEVASRTGCVQVVDRDPSFRRIMREAIAGRRPDLAVREAEAAAAMALDHDVAAILLTLEDDGRDALAALERAAAAGPVVVVSGSGSLSLAVAAMRAGATDFLVKPVRGDAVVDALSRVLEGSRQSVRPRAAPSTGYEGFIGRSQAMRGVFDQISRIAASRAPVLVTGESGTGKELCAEALHGRSGRRGGFVAVNCGAIPRDLMESELFGHVRGAFTGAHEDRVGAVELADGGTLFLDEIGEMEPGLQTKLLRFVQTETLCRVGDANARPVDVRIVCATNRDPAAEVAAGRFREDLYYRLNVLPIHLPPLRARRDDILPLAQAFLARFANEEGRGFAAFEPDANALLVNYDWPGNVRQLQNVVRRVVVMNDAVGVSADMLALGLAHAGGRQTAPAAPVSAPRAPAIEPFWIQEKRIIERALETFGGNVGRAAAALEISPSTIYRKKQAWDADSAAA